MTKRGLIYTTTPELYALYYLKLKYNLGPQQLLTSWKDYERLDAGPYYRDQVPHYTVKDLLDKVLIKFWTANQTTPLTRPEHILRFAKRYSLDWWVRWFYRV